MCGADRHSVSGLVWRHWHTCMGLLLNTSQGPMAPCAAHRRVAICSSVECRTRRAPTRRAVRHADRKRTTRWSSRAVEALEGAKAFWEMVLCTPTCEREGDVSKINSLGVMRFGAGRMPVATMRHRHSPRLCVSRLAATQKFRLGLCSSRSRVEVRGLAAVRRVAVAVTTREGWQCTPHASRTAGAASGEAEGTSVDGESRASLGAVSGRPL